MKRRLFIIAQVVLLALIGNTVVAGAALNPQHVTLGTDPARSGQTPAHTQPFTPTGSGFTYQGSLKSGGNPANGQYDFTFALFDAPAPPNQQIGSTITMTNQTVTDGLFTVQLDFGSGAFQGDARWLEISVRQTGGGTYTTLSPRQALTPAPYAAGVVPGTVISGSVGSALLTLNNSAVGDGIDMTVGGNGLQVTTTGPYNAFYTDNSCSCATLYATNAGTGPGVHGVSTNGYGVQGTSTNGNAIDGQSSNNNATIYGSNGSTGLGGLFTSSAGNGAEGYSSANNGIGLYGENDTGTGATGVYGSSNTGTGVYAASGGLFGLYAYANATNGYGVYGRANSGPNAAGVYGTSSSGYGGYFTSSNTNGYGVYGQATSGSNATGVYGTSSSGTGVYATGGGQYGLYAIATGTNGNGVYGRADSGSNAAGVSGVSTSGFGGYFTSGATNGSGVYGQANGGSTAAGVYGTSTSGYGGYFTSAGTNAMGVAGVSGSGFGGVFTSTNGIAIRGFGNANLGGYFTSNTSNGAEGYSTANNGVGLYGQEDTGTGASGVYGSSNTGTGVIGVSAGPNETGVYGSDLVGNGVAGYSQYGNGIYGTAYSGWAGYFDGNVNVTGLCCASGESTIRIDDPTDPANKILNQSVVASPDMLEIYRGHVTLDANGNATVQLPSYFQALNRNFDYQLTPVGASMPDLYVAQEIVDNTFKIAGGKPGGKVSWQVTGVRQDPYAKAHPIQPEQNKPADQQGKYLYPKELGQPESLGVDYEKSHAQSLVARPTQQPLPSGH